MMCLIGFISGLVNGLFATGGGIILLFYFIFIKKFDTYDSRFTNILILVISSIITLINYIKIVDINMDLFQILIIIFLSCIFGNLGNKIMFKINKNILNILSAIIIIILSIYGIVK